MGNSCTGGFKSVRKRTKKTTISADEPDWNEFAIVCSELLPIEVWKNILNYLKGSTKEMLKCRLVCHDFKNLSDELLQRQPLWTPLFPYISSMPLIFIGGYGETVIRRTRGSRFASARRLNSFLTQMKGYTGNPFPNRTVLLFPNPDLCIPSRRPHHYLFKRFPTLVNRFGEHIWSLEYCVREDVPESVYLLRSLYQLQNLKSLTLYTRDWNKRSVRQGLMHLKREIASLCPPEGSNGLLESLTQLQIMGSNGILPLNFLFGRIGSQIKSLYFCFVDDASSIVSSGGGGDGRASEIDASAKEEIIYSLTDLAPNVTKLKVYEVSEDLVDKILPHPIGNKKLSQLQYLSIKLQRPFVGPLNRIVTAIDEHCQASLQSLHIEISRWPPQDASSDEDEEDNQPQRAEELRIDTKVKLISLQDLTMSYSLFLQEPQFLFKFTEKCPSLKSLSFVSVNIHGGHFPDFEGFCKPLWGRLPSSLEKISVRYWISYDFWTGAYLDKKQGLVGRRRQRQKRPEPIPKLQTCRRPTI